MRKDAEITFINLTTGELVRLKRLALKIPQYALAARARVSIEDVRNLEKDGYLSRIKKTRVFAVLGLSEYEADGTGEPVNPDRPDQGESDKQP